MMPGIMRRNAIVRSVAILAAAFASRSPAQVPPGKTESARLLALGGERFSIRRTDHFLIASDGDDAVVNRLADRLEATYQAVVRFAEDMKLSIHPPPDPLPVLLFNRHSEFVRYAGTLGHDDPNAPGFYLQRNNTAAFCSVLDLPQLRDISQRIEQAEAPERITEWKSQRDAIVETFNRLVIQHEAAHQVLFNTGVLPRNSDNPYWLVEGLACLFEGSSPDAVNQMRLADFREAFAAEPASDNAAASAVSAPRSDKRSLSLANLVVDDRFLVAAGESNRAIYYAQAWAFVDYLYRTRGDGLAAYLRRIAAPSPNERADRQHRLNEFQSTFGSLDQAFELEWIESVLDLPFDPPRVRR